MTKPERPSSSTVKSESNRPDVEMVFEVLFGSGDPLTKEKA